MSRRPKDIGTWTETSVVLWLHDHGFPHAERRALYGSADRGDILVTAGIIFEVKGGKAAETASDDQIAAWLVEAEKERVNAGADLCPLILKRKGKGRVQAGSWWFIVPSGGWMRLPPPGIALRMTLDEGLRWLRASGYGESL